MKGHIRERGKGNWYAVLDEIDPETNQRKRKWRKLEAKGSREAETELAGIIAQLAKGTYVDPQKTTLAQYLDRWLAAIKPNVSLRTHERYTEIVKKNINPFLGRVMLKKLNGLQIAEAYTKALETGRRD